MRLAAAGNSVVVNHKSYPQRHGVQLYNRIRSCKGHSVAVGAVARHFVQAGYGILKRQEANRRGASSIQWAGEARFHIREKIRSNLQVVSRKI